MSGEEESVFWVTVGFSSPLEPNDVLHIVCAKILDASDEENGMDSIYLERFDQAYSCYSGAEKIVASSTSITVELNSHGQQSLYLPSQVEFTNANINGFKDAVEILRTMSHLPWGNTIAVA